MASETTIPNFLRKRAHLTPHRVAFIFENQEVTFSECFNQANSLAGKFATLGVKKEENIAVMLSNHIDTVFLIFALQLLGARAVLLNNRLTYHEIQWQMNDSNSLFLLTEEKFSSIYSNLEGAIYLKSELDQQTSTEIQIQEEINLNDICSIMYTSGTTGNPKGVLQTYGNHWWSATGSALNLGINDHDRWICSVPLFHISGYSILMRGIIYGMTVMIHEGFNEEKIIDDIVNNRVTIISVVSTMLSRILDKMKEPFPSTFRCMLVGGGPVPKGLLEACVDRDIPVYQTYGMTETASQVVTLSPEDSLQKLGSAGKPLFPVQLKIVSSDGNEVKAKQSGEILIKAPNVTKGYLNTPEGSDDKIQNGWLSTGDIGYLDEEGFLFVLDRRSDLIISGGENIYPAEIEGVLHSHHEVMDVGVIGVKDENWGHVPIAFVVTKTDSSQVKSEQLITFCQLKLAKFKVPRQIVFMTELPRNAAKKLMRHKLREWWEERQNEY